MTGDELPAIRVHREAAGRLRRPVGGHGQGDAVGRDDGRCLSASSLMIGLPSK
jgi:hypothetical protein